MVEKIKGYDYVVYYRGEACNRAGKILFSFGYKYMGDINKLPDVLQLIERGLLDKSASMQITSFR